MSMILDALSRAEKERQTENSTDLDTARYVTSSTIKEDRFKKWVLVALVANFILVIGLASAYVWKNQTVNTSDAIVDNSVIQQIPEAIISTNESVQIASSENPQVEPMLTAEIAKPQETESVEVVNLTDSTGKASTSSLLDEAKVKNNKSIASKIKKVSSSATAKKPPPVQYSSKPLSATPQTSQPTVASISQAVARERQATATTSYTKLGDIPVSQRAQLGQYEVNVHVYDDNPQNRFVLINMVKYKEGDRLSGSNASISTIVPEGVVLNYANQQILIERNK